jgi:hypothetical protein
LQRRNCSACDFNLVVCVRKYAEQHRLHCTRKRYSRANRHGRQRA